MEPIDLAIMLCSAASVAYLLLGFRTEPPVLDVQDRADDPARRVSEAIREIEFDFEAGKLSKEDFEQVRNQAVAELARTLKTKKENT